MAHPVHGNGSNEISMIPPNRSDVRASDGHTETHCSQTVQVDTSILTTPVEATSEETSQSAVLAMSARARKTSASRNVPRRRVASLLIVVGATSPALSHNLPANNPIVSRSFLAALRRGTRTSSLPMLHPDSLQVCAATAPAPSMRGAMSHPMVSIPVQGTSTGNQPSTGNCGCASRQRNSIPMASAAVSTIALICADT